MKTVLVTSSSFDEHTHGPVIERLAKRGFSVILYQTDKVLDGSEQFSLSVDESGHLEMTYEGRDMGPDAISAGWYWKVGNFSIPDAGINVSKQLSLVNELTQCNSNIWGNYPDDLWLSSPRHIQSAEQKLRQLIVARQVGFSIPPTRMGNRWEDLESGIGPAGTEMIVKMFRGVIADQNEIKAMYTTRLHSSLLEKLRESTVPFPGVYQPFVPKAREWRITVVGDDVFAGAIYTQDEAKDDWRRMQETASVALRREPLSDDIATLCRKYLDEMQLGIGSFDLVEEPSGRVVFLECNPQGQFGFLEEHLDLPVSDAVANRLVVIAQAR